MSLISDESNCQTKSSGLSADENSKSDNDIDNYRNNDSNVEVIKITTTEVIMIKIIMKIPYNDNLQESI